MTGFPDRRRILLMEPDPDEHLHPGEEDLAWTEERANLFKDVKPRGQYSLISDAARSVISTEKQCAFFCGGKKCKYCIGKGWKKEEMVIPGLYSHWVTDKILAMARPTNDGLQRYDQLKEFKKQGIQSILNLQTPGEHADCGPNKLDPSGFSYNPQAFMDEKIFFYNYGWPDYGVASLSKILDMVKVMQFSLSEGKIAVHCHAGRGRTGVIIACYLIFTNRMDWREAIHYVREKRAGSIQTRAQIEVIEDFEKYLQPFRIVFASRRKDSHEFSLQQFLNRQKQILHGYEARKLKYLPKVVYTVCERLLELAQRGKALTRLHSQICSTSRVQSEPSILSISSNPSQTHFTSNVKSEPSIISINSSFSETISTSSVQSEPSTISISSSFSETISTSSAQSEPSTLSVSSTTSQTLSTSSVQSELSTLSVSSTPSQTLSTDSVQSEPSAISVSSTSKGIHKNKSDESLFDLNSTLRSPSLALLRNKLRSISMEDLQNDQFKDVLDETDNKSSASSGGDTVGPVISKESIANDGQDKHSVDNKFSDNLHLSSHKSCDNLSIASLKSSDILSIASDRSSDSSSLRRKKKKNVLRSKKLEIDKSESDSVRQLSNRFDNESLQMSTNNNNASSSVERVVIGLVHEVSHSALERAKQCEAALNESDSAWSLIIEETDPQVLATILWDWLDQLKEPVLRVQDLRLILNFYDDPNTGLLKLEKGTSCMIQYFVNVFSRLKSNEDKLKKALYEKILSHLTHQWVDFDCIQTIMDGGVMTPRNLPVEEKDHWSYMRPEHAEKLFIFFLTLMESSERRK